jgi:hypothetical protein
MIRLSWANPQTSKAAWGLLNILFALQSASAQGKTS